MTVRRRRRSMHWLWLAAALVVIPARTLAVAGVPSGWEYAQELAVAAPGLVELAIPPAALDRARRGLEDVRIVDGAGREVPYLIRARPMPQNTIKQTMPTRIKR